MTNEIQTSEANGNQPFLEKVQDEFLKLIKDKTDAVSSEFNQTRFLQNCMSVLVDTKNIEQGDPLSIARCIIKGAFLDLDFLNKECYLVPYNKKVGTNWVTEFQFQTDYKGEKKLAKKYSINPIKDIYAKIVRKGDEFEEAIVNGMQTINFKPIPFNNENVIGAFAVALFKDGNLMYEVMSIEEINSVKTAYAKTNKDGKYSKAWESSAGEMYKKTVYRRLCKHIELDFGSIDKQKVWNESSDMEFNKKEPVKVIEATSSLDSVNKTKKMED